MKEAALAGLLLALLLVAPGRAETPAPGIPTCEVFSDTWEPSEMSQTMLAAMAFSAEKTAVDDCLKKKDIATACRHWTGMLRIVDKTPALEYSRGDLEKLMAENHCAH